jgi:predicted esterase
MQFYKDARTSLMKMEELADSLNFDKDKIGIMGFSAGGWLAEHIVYKYMMETTIGILNLWL